MVWGGGLSGWLGAASMGFAGDCGMRWWGRHANVSAGCSLMCIGECQCTQGATVKLWTITWLACGFLVCIAVSYCASGDMLGGMLVSFEWWYASRFFLFFCVCVLWLWFLVVHGASFYFRLCFKLFIWFYLVRILTNCF